MWYKSQVNLNARKYPKCLIPRLTSCRAQYLFQLTISILSHTQHHVEPEGSFLDHVPYSSCIQPHVEPGHASEEITRPSVESNISMTLSLIKLSFKTP